ncbi:pyridoxamine 5'-phosphate oxidase family protein [Halobellus sp. EA9]|uniref:pyridoxamine 5'-phosphate oxidase family protein n=1 Tax=Halobellus sp. EA9 TaxID=3421647 RepID=UPI003EC04122
MPEAEVGVEMTDEEITAFLTRQGHGVLSFAGEEPYSLPISFGYDVLENRCIFQLVFHDESTKRERIASSSRVTLVSYEWRGPDDWRSVIIDGDLRWIDDESPEVLDASEVFAEYASLAGLAVFDRPTPDLDPEWYELEIESMSGRHAPAVASIDAIE